MIMNKRDFLKKISSTSLLFFSLLPINFFIDINKSIKKKYRKINKKIWILNSDDF